MAPKTILELPRELGASHRGESSHTKGAELQHWYSSLLVTWHRIQVLRERVAALSGAPCVQRELWSCRQYRQDLL